ncbi:MAG TPA: phosphatidylinositol mannoside acyltransferase [Acidimicrobiia bacterium]
MKQYLAYLALRLGVGAVGLLPASWARSLGCFGGQIWHRFASGRRIMAERHMARVLGSDADAVAAGKEVMVSYGRYWAEALWARARRVPGMMERTTVIGLDYLTAARDAGNGAIFALPHLGNWEAAAPIAVNEHMPVVAVAENLVNTRITDWFTSMRGEFGIEIVLATGSTEVMRSLERAIGENKAIALLSDRDLKGRGVEVEFFGEVTTMPPGPATLAIRTGAPLHPIGCYFDGPGYRIVVHEQIPVPDGDSRIEIVQAMTQTLARKLEQIINEAPEQWHLVQPNWPSDREVG